MVLGNPFFPKRMDICAGGAERHGCSTAGGALPVIISSCHCLRKLEAQRPRSYGNFDIILDHIRPRGTHDDAN